MDYGENKYKKMSAKRTYSPAYKWTNER